MMWTQELYDFVKEHQNEDVKELALHIKRNQNIDIQFAIQQIKGRQIMKTKSSTWYEYDKLVYPKHLSLEQASSEITAKYKKRLCKGETFVDLTGGLGIDFYFMSADFKSSTYVEQNQDLEKIAKYNLEILSHKNQVETRCEDSVSYLKSMEPVDIIYIDPARRDQNGKKTVAIGDCTPDLVDIDTLLNEKSKRTIIKLSPMLDISVAINALTNISSVHVLSIKNECKELVFVKDNALKSNQLEVKFHCVNFASKGEVYFDFSNKDRVEVKYSSTLLRYLYEPNSSVLKAGGYNYLQKEYKVEKLHPNSHLYTSENLIANFPGRIFEIDKQVSLTKKDIKDYISPLGYANLTTRNFPVSVNDLRKKLKIKEGGDKYIFATTLMNEDKVLIVTKKI